ncbi:hypothetical protein PLUTE_a2757 [Pseudoalteromonas luteoviolacea DSM 6061]|nr:hypothetical protein [Pseudoalteromonas luteoviolacea DSM 6061]
MSKSLQFYYLKHVAMSFCNVFYPYTSLQKSKNLIQIKLSEFSEN